MSLKPWKTLSSKIVHETPWIQVKEDLCNIDGTQLTYTYTNRKDEGPMIIPEDSDGKLWLVEQYRHPIKKIIWQFPCEGKMPDESWETAAKRGLKEELSKEATQVVQIGVSHPDPGGLEQVTHVFLMTGLKDIQYESHEELVAGEVEDLRGRAFSLQEINQMIDNGEICDSWTLTGLFLYERYKRQTKQ